MNTETQTVFPEFMRNFEPNGLNTHQGAKENKLKIKFISGLEMEISIMRILEKFR